MSVFGFRPVLGLLGIFLSGSRSAADPVPLRYVQGSEHAFAVIKALDGVRIATGEITELVRGTRVTLRVVFQFRDGSVDDETTVFSQAQVLRLISDHHIQRGPAFSKPMNLNINAVTGQVIYQAKDGKLTEEHMDLPADVCNGLLPTLLMNILPSTPETKVSFVAGSEKPRLVHLSIKPAGEMSLPIGGLRRKATDYSVHVEIGGVAGVVAPIVGKEPSDVHFWILGGAFPAFVREEGQLYEGGPVWRIEQIIPTLNPEPIVKGMPLRPQ